jgi:chemotaxis protein methyltransferase WspC
MNVRAVAEQLQRRIGVDPSSLGSNVLVNIVANRMRALGLTDPQRYAAHVQDSAAEFAALIDDVVVSETWFFRGGKVFSFLAEQARCAILSAPPTSTFRILSAPCSTGEEPYSMVIALIEAGVPRERWAVESVDLSARSLARARQGIYRESSFRETPAQLRRKYFHKSDGSWEFDPSLRELVRFRQGNLLDPELLGGEGLFDLIFCRNVLIYLHAEARTCVLANLDRLLAPRGLLCMGHAEPLSLLDPRFQVTGPHDYFLFQRRRERKQNHVASTGEMPVPPRAHSRPVRSAPCRSRPQSLSSTQSAIVEAGDLLLQARQEADAGALDKALQICRAHLAVAEPSAHAYSLLGIIHQARQEKTESIECFRRALYLDPHHEEALLHLLLLYQESGKEAAALRLRRRLRRKAAGGEA